MNRRRFLGGVGAAVGGLYAADALFYEPRGPDARPDLVVTNSAAGPVTVTVTEYGSDREVYRRAFDEGVTKIKVLDTAAEGTGAFVVTATVPNGGSDSARVGFEDDGHPPDNGQIDVDVASAVSIRVTFTIGTGSACTPPSRCE